MGHAATTITVLSTIILTSLALTASTVSAQGLEVVHEGGAHCNPCDIHAVAAPGASGEVHAHTIFGEFLISHCTSEWEAQIFEDGSGHAYRYANNHATSQDCTRVGCTGVGEAPGEAEWPITNAEETGPNEGHFRLGLCLDAESDPGATGFHCELQIHFEEDPATPHRYILTADGSPCPTDPRTEITSTWVTEATTHDAIEIEHL